MSSKSKSLFKKLLSSVLSAACLLSGTAVVSTAIGSAVDSANITAEAAASSDQPPFSWDNATVYFLLTDRFCNGDPSNDNAYGRMKTVAGDSRATFHGGDFAGITKKINEGYFNDLGVNAIWMTAPYEQLHGYILGENFAHYSYHGYYVTDYTEPDAAYGTKAEFKTLVDTAHEHGIRIIMDIVMNHAGYNNMIDMNEYNYGTLLDGWKQVYDAGDLGNYHKKIDYESSAEDWSRWWGPDWIRSGLPGYSEQGDGPSEQVQCLTGLPDFKTESQKSVGIPQFLQTKWQKEGTLSEKMSKYGSSNTVTGYISTWLAEWVETYGIDGFRCDTAKHVEFGSWNKLKQAGLAALKKWRQNNPSSPGANWTDDFWMTGECWDHGCYKDGYYTEGGFDSMINFETTGAGLLSMDRIAGVYEGYAGKINSDPSFNVLSYISSHDTVLARGDQYYLGSAFLMLPGGVQIYYGDETNRPLVPGIAVSGDGHAVRSDMNWDSIDTAVLAHWQKVGTFRNNHLSVGAGANVAMTASSGVGFGRTYSKNGTEDKIAAVIGASANTDVSLDVSAIWADGTMLTNYYDDSSATVSGGKITFNSGAHGTILISEPDGKRGRVVVTHINNDTGETIKTETLSGLLGESYTASPLTMEGFTVSKTVGSKTGTFSETDASVTFYYKFDVSNYAYVTTKYVDAASGTEIADSETTSAKIGSTYNVSVKDIKDYEFDSSKSDSTSGTVKSGTNTVTLKYNYVEPTNLKVHYYNSNGWASVYMYAYQGEGSTATQLLGAWPGKQMTAESDGWFVCEVPDVESARVLFTASANGPQEPGQEKPGYELSGEVWMKDGKSQTMSKVKVLYVTTDGKTLGSETLSGMSGDTYNTSPKTFTDYELTETPANATGNFGSSTVTVTYTYKSTKPDIDPLANTSKVSATSITIGSSVKVTCSSTGGAAPVKYAVYYKKSSASNWTTAQDYSSTTSVTVTPKYAETYTIRVKVKDSAGTIKSNDYTVKVAGNFANTSKISSTSVSVGSSVTVTCSSTGGTGTVKYAVWYKRSTVDEWTKGQDYSTNKTVTIKPAHSGTYTVRVKAKNGDGTVKNKDFTLKSTSPLTNTSKVSATSIALGSSVKVTCSATGGTGTKKYAVWYKRSTVSDWTKGQDYSTNTSVTVKPAHTGTYTVRVKAKDGAGTVKNKDFTVKVAAALTNTSKLSATSITLGKSITITCASTGGTGTKKYAVYYKKSSASDWSKKQDYSTTTSVTFKPGTATTYTIRVKVKDGAGTIKNKDLTLKVTSAALVNTSTISTNAILSGKSFTVNCSSTGGSGTKKYAVWYKKTDATSWTTAQSYSTNASVSVTLKSVGTYDVSIKVKDGNDKVSAQYYTVAVNKASSSFKNTSTISATSVSAGTKITLKGASTDPVEMAMYKYEYKSESASSYTTIKDFTTSTSAYFTPKSAGRYFVRVIAQDMNPTTKVKNFTVTVK